LAGGAAVSVLGNFGVAIESVDSFLSVRRSSPDDAPNEHGSFIGKSAQLAAC
jgi:hypothetical protein